MSMESNNSWHVKSLWKAIDILECFSFEKKELSITEIVNLTGLNKSTARRLVANLVERNFLRKNLTSKKYCLGLRLFQMGSIVYSSFSLKDASSLPISNLHNKINATVLLGVRDDDKIIYLDKREGFGMISISAVFGLIRPITFGILGRVLMAHMTIEEVEAILKINHLKQYAPNSITTKKALFSELNKIRKQGYAIEVDEFVEGVMGLAAPIKNHSRKTIAAIGVYLPAIEQKKQEEVQRIIKLLVATSETISKDIGFL